MRIVLATENHHKLLEFQRILHKSQIQWITLTDLQITSNIAENGVTFAENAELKAREICRIADLPTLADDSGLTVDALGGRPGVHTARYGGPKATQSQQLKQLLNEMQTKAWETRSAQFRCAVALAIPGLPTMVTAEGVCPGVIALQPRGRYGFGYDPIFYLPEHRQTMAELTPLQKDRISHRGLAARSISNKIHKLL